MSSRHQCRGTLRLDLPPTEEALVSHQLPMDPLDYVGCFVSDVLYFIVSTPNEIIP